MLDILQWNFRVLLCFPWTISNEPVIADFGFRCNKQRFIMAIRFLFLLLFCFSVTLHADQIDQLGRPVDEALFAEEPIRFKVELSGAKDNVKIAKLKDGSTVYIVKRIGSKTDRMVTPTEFAQLYYSQQTSRGWIFTFFNVTSWAGIIWVVVGLAGQLIFAGRMLVQWISSEKSKRSVIPVSFWWMSVIGSTMLLVYFIWRRDVVGILGQATGWIIYIRNLVLIQRAKV